MNKLEQIKDLTNNRMSELDEIATRISYDPRLTPYMIRKPGKEAIEELHRYKSSSSFIDSMFIYYPEHEEVYSNLGSSSINNYFENIYNLNLKDRKSITHALKEVSSPTLQSMNLNTAKIDEQPHLISYIYPIPPRQTATYGTVIFFIKQHTIKHLIGNILGEFNGNVFIFDDKNTLLSSENVGDEMGANHIPINVLTNSGVFHQEIKGEEYSIVSVKSDKTGWTFVTSMPKSQFYGRVVDMQTSILGLVLLITLIGIGAAVYLTIKHYKPIQSLSRYMYINHRTYSNPKLTRIDELAKIRETMEQLFEHREQLQEKVSFQQSLVKEQYLLRLLKGDVKKEDEIDKVLTELQLQLNGKHFFVTKIFFQEEQLQQINRNEIINVLSQFLDQKDKVGYAVELVPDHSFVLIVNFHDEIVHKKSVQHEFAENLANKMQEYCQQNPTIGIGRIYEGINWINRSFIEASAAIEYKLINGHGSVIFFDEINDKDGKAFWYPIDEQVKFIQSIKQGDEAVASESLKKIIHSLENESASIHVLRCKCYDIINTVLKTVYELELTEEIADLRSLVNFRSLKDLDFKLQQVIVTICEAVEQRKESHNNYLRDEILDYIQKQYKQHDLGLDKTAEVFQLSSSYLSRFMKEQTGVTFTQFVWDLRYQEFKRQLLKTDKSIKELVIDIGYLNVASFTRKFKAAEGLTPGQYRKQYQQDKKVAN